MRHDDPEHEMPAESDAGGEAPDGTSIDGS
jgi:hypothetical protein